MSRRIFASSSTTRTRANITPGRAQDGSALGTRPHQSWRRGRAASSSTGAVFLGPSYVRLGSIADISAIGQKRARGLSLQDWASFEAALRPWGLSESQRPSIHCGGEASPRARCCDLESPFYIPPAAVWLRPIHRADRTSCGSHRALGGSPSTLARRLP